MLTPKKPVAWELRAVVLLGFLLGLAEVFEEQYSGDKSQSNDAPEGRAVGHPKVACDGSPEPVAGGVAEASPDHYAQSLLEGLWKVVLDLDASHGTDDHYKVVDDTEGDIFNSHYLHWLMLV